MSTFTPTDEQIAALEIFKTGKSLAIEAGAGAGKTSTLKLLAQSTNRRGQYVAFNKAIVADVKASMPDTVACNTAHSLAFRAVGRNYSGRMNSRRLKSYEIATILRLDPIRVKIWDDTSKELSRTFLAGIVMNAVTRFCQTGDPEPSWRHVEFIEGLDAPTSTQRPTSREANREVAHQIEGAMKRAWAELRMYQGALTFSHAHYLKIWERSSPRLACDYILFDECQDASGVMLSVVDQQENTQKVFVGDENQEIYAWSGAVNALERIKETGECERTMLTQSFRFGDAIAAQANTLLTNIDLTLRSQGKMGTDLRLNGLASIPSVVSHVDRADAILTRTNAVSVRAIMAEQASGGHPFLVGGGKDVIAFARAAQRLMQGQRVEHRELACFETWGEVLIYVNEDEMGGELKLNVDLIEEFGVETILATLERMPSEENATLIVSTAHKSKGREWGAVRLTDDFPKENPSVEDLRLLYVACTRAKHALDITKVGYLNGMVTRWRTG